jgi:uncharacterized protein
LDEKGIPTPVERTFIIPPQSRIGPVTDAERAAVMQNSLVQGVYEKQVDRESAYEVLKKRAAEVAAETAPKEQDASNEDRGFNWGGVFGGGKRRTSRSDTILESAAKSTVRAIGSQLGRQIIRGVLGSIFKGK